MDELRKQQFEMAEEAFFDRYIDPELSDLENYEANLAVFHDKYALAQDLCEKVSYGEVVDNSRLQLAIEEMILSYKQASLCRRNVDGGVLYNPSSSNVDDMEKVELAIKGNELVGEHAMNQDFDKYEQGKWCLYNTLLS